MDKPIFKQIEDVIFTPKEPDGLLNKKRNSLLLFIVLIIIGGTLIISFVLFIGFLMATINTPSNITSTTNEVVENQPQAIEKPETTDVPGVGIVYVECIQNTLSEDEIIQMVQDKSLENLPLAKKQAAEKCIVE